MWGISCLREFCKSLKNLKIESLVKNKSVNEAKADSYVCVFFFQGLTSLFYNFLLKHYVFLLETYGF